MMIDVILDNMMVTDTLLTVRKIGGCNKKELSAVIPILMFSLFYEYLPTSRRVHDMTDMPM